MSELYRWLLLSQLPEAAAFVSDEGFEPPLFLLPK